MVSDGGHPIRSTPPMCSPYSYRDILAGGSFEFSLVTERVGSTTSPKPRNLPMTDIDTLALDMDGVLADWDGGFRRSWSETHPDLHHLYPTERKQFKLSEEFPEEHRERAMDLSRVGGFYRNLEPIPGALEAAAALKDLARSGKLSVFILTAPMTRHATCAQEKVAWVEHYLGPWWVDGMCIIRDKTRVNATYLVDDKPDVTGSMTPTWEHIVFEAPYNRDVNRKRLTHWANWKTELLPLLKL